MARNTDHYFKNLIKRAQVRRDYEDIMDELWEDYRCSRVTGTEYDELLTKARKEMESKIALII